MIYCLSVGWNRLRGEYRAAVLTVSEGVLAAGDRVHLRRRNASQIDKGDDLATSESHARGVSYSRQLPQLPQLFVREG